MKNKLTTLLLSLTAALILLALPGSMAHQSYQLFYLEGPQGLEPSGLTFHRGRLLMVSDDHPRSIFSISMETGTRARVSTWLTISLPPGISSPDFEGITSRGNHLFLVSERYNRILQVDQQGQAQWYGPSLEQYGNNRGMLTRSNAGLEGIALINETTLLVCAERSQRGFFLVNRAGKNWEIRALPHTGSRYSLQPGRDPDCSGLYVYKKQCYMLSRGQHRIMKIRLQDKGIMEASVAEYREIEENRATGFQDKRFGKAEGIAMDERYWYLVFDNNGRARKGNDNRPVLVRMERDPTTR